MRVALVHDWLTGMRGGERVLEGFMDLFPNAEIFTLMHIPGSVSEEIEARPIHTSFVQHLPGSAGKYRWYLPVFPWAIEQLDLSGFDLVLSSSHCAAKAVVTDPGSVHLCYCHTPMRYAWDQFDAYFSAQRNGRARYLMIRAVIAWLRRWDRATAARVDAFAANSAWVADRIERYYGRTATVIPPPVDTGFFTPVDNGERNDYYLVVSALSPYKRIDVVIEAFNRMQRPLVVAGSGPDAERLEELAGPTVEVRGWVDKDTLRELYRRSRGLVLAAVEDAGIVPLEAMACGRPAIVLNRGGAPEAVIDGRTGIYIREQSATAVAEAIDRADRVSFNSAEIGEAALHYGADRFASRISTFVAEALQSADLLANPPIPAARRDPQTELSP